MNRILTCLRASVRRSMALLLAVCLLLPSFSQLAFAAGERYAVVCTTPVGVFSKNGGTGTNRVVLLVGSGSTYQDAADAAASMIEQGPGLGPVPYCKVSAWQFRDGEAPEQGMGAAVTADKQLEAVWTIENPYQLFHISTAGTLAEIPAAGDAASKQKEYWTDSPVTLTLPDMDLKFTNPDKTIIGNAYLPKLEEGENEISFYLQYGNIVFSELITLNIVLESQVPTLTASLAEESVLDTDADMSPRFERTVYLRGTAGRAAKWEYEKDDSGEWVPFEPAEENSTTVVTENGTYDFRLLSVTGAVSNESRVTVRNIYKGKPTLGNVHVTVSDATGTAIPYDGSWTSKLVTLHISVTDAVPGYRGSVTVKDQYDNEYPTDWDETEQAYTAVVTGHDFMGDLDFTVTPVSVSGATGDPWTGTVKYDPTTPRITPDTWTDEQAAYAQSANITVFITHVPSGIKHCTVIKPDGTTEIIDASDMDYLTSEDGAQSQYRFVYTVTTSGKYDFQAISNALMVSPICSVQINRVDSAKPVARVDATVINPDTGLEEPYSGNWTKAESVRITTALSNHLKNSCGMVKFFIKSGAAEEEEIDLTQAYHSELLNLDVKNQGQSSIRIVPYGPSGVKGDEVLISPVKIDSQAPQNVTISAAGDGHTGETGSENDQYNKLGAFRTSPVVELSAEDSASGVTAFQVYLNNDSNTPTQIVDNIQVEGIRYIAQVSLGENITGVVKIRVEAVDEAGNVSQEATGSLVVDRDAPTISASYLDSQDGPISTGNQNAPIYTNSMAKVVLSITDPYLDPVGDGVDVAVKLDNVPIPIEDLNMSTNSSNCTMTVKLGGVPNGRHSITAEARDEAGNYVSVKLREFILDTEPPEVGIQYTYNVKDADGNTPVFTTDAVTTYSSVLCASSAVQMTFVIHDDNLAENEDDLIDNQLYVRVSKDGWEQEVKYDRHDYSKTAQTLKATITLGGNNANQDGSYTVYLAVTDLAGNKGSVSSATVIVDHTTPKISYTYNANQLQQPVYYAASPVLVGIDVTDTFLTHTGKAIPGSISVNGAPTGVSFAVKSATNGSASEGGASIKIGDGEYAAPGSYQITSDVRDEAGNAASAQSTTIVYDPTAPTGSINVGSLGTWGTTVGNLTFRRFSSGGQTVTINASDAVSGVASVAYRLYTGDTALTRGALDAWTAWVPYNGPFPLRESVKATVYAKITDMAGNVTYCSSDGFIIDTVSPTAGDGTSPIATVTATAGEGGVYAGSVTVLCTAEDPLVNGVSSGIRSVTYQILRDGSVYQDGTLYSYDVARGGPLVRTLGAGSLSITIPGAIDSNQVTVAVTVTDNAGNSRTVTSPTMKIDNTPPEVSVSMTGKEVGSGYFATGRTATITVVERNFNPDDVTLAITGSATQSGWVTSADGLTHTQTVTFSKDGDYTFALSVQDMAGHMVPNSAVHYEGASVAAFTVDQTAPVLSFSAVDAAGTAVEQDTFSRSDVTGVLTINEHNFAAADLRLACDMDGVALEQELTWEGSGDSHTATLAFSEDGYYTVQAYYVDLAGNESEVASVSFYVDKTAPVITLAGLTNHSANNGETIAPEITVSDKYYVPGNVTVTLTGVNSGKQKDFYDVTALTEGKDAGELFAFQNIAEDDLYTICVTATDAAGNRSSEIHCVGAAEPVTEFAFSVNRNGSVFTLSKATQDQVRRHYINDPGDVVIVETNVDILDARTVTLARGLADTQALVAGAEDGYSAVEASVDGGWTQITYTIPKERFAQDGLYTVSIATKDEAGNLSTNQAGASASFVVDTTAPVLEVSPEDLRSGGIYRATDKTVPLMARDENLSLLTVTVDGEVVSEWTEAEMTGTIFTNSFIIPGTDTAQNVEITCVDKAGNESDVLDIDHVTVSSSWFVLFLANRAAVALSLGGIAAATAAVAAPVAHYRKKKRNRMYQRQFMKK